MSRLLETFAIIWRLAHPYFFSDDRWPGRILLAAVIAIELALVGINVAINHWQNRFYNALQDRAWNTFVEELMFFGILAAIYVVLAAYQLYLQQWLLIRFRAWTTRRYLNHWLVGSNHYRMQLLGDAADNPDQRIAEDIRLFAERGILIGVRVLGATVSFLSFVVILWTLSADAPFQLFGYEISIPGYLVWAALIYAIAGTLVTHFIGRRLIGLNFQQQRYEADFRFNLVRVRENSEQIALLQGEAAENERLRQRFAFVIANWWQIMLRLKRLTFLTAGYRQFSAVFPYIVVGPAYFAGKVQLGGLMQTVTAFDNVREALSIFIDVYREIAEWRAVIARLDGFDAAIAAGAGSRGSFGDRRHTFSRQRGHRDSRPPGATTKRQAPGCCRRCRNQARRQPVGQRSVRCAASRPCSGSLPDIWPFGSGQIVVPAGARVLMLPQQPYFLVATLATAVTYPAASGTFTNARIAEVIAAVGLPDLVARLDEEAHWNRILSLGEQQRLAIARAILQKPEFLFLDEATASLDEPAEDHLYRLLISQLPGTTIVSIAHRESLAAFHGRRLTLMPDGDHRRLREHAIAPAVS